ncbi:hypothetical protein M3J09_007991 [Ascochyta lentis]
MDTLTPATSPEPCSFPLLPTADQHKNTSDARDTSKDVSLQDDSGGSPKKDSLYKRAEELNS